MISGAPVLLFPAYAIPDRRKLVLRMVFPGSNRVINVERDGTMIVIVFPGRAFLVQRVKDVSELNNALAVRGGVVCPVILLVRRDQPEAATWLHNKLEPKPVIPAVAVGEIVNKKYRLMHYPGPNLDLSNAFI